MSPILHQHHPDCLRWPEAAGPADRRVHAMTWNLFRTFDWLPPAFWLRHLHARFGCLDTLGPAPQLARVSLWQPLDRPPAQRLIAGPAGTVIVDVVIETEYAVWTILVSSDDGTRWAAEAEREGGPVQRAIEAGAWLAGRRDAHCGLVVADRHRARAAAALAARYDRSSESLVLQSGARAGRLTNVRSLGLTDWPSLTSILAACAETPGLSAPERAAARHTLGWMRKAGATEEQE